MTGCMWGCGVGMSVGAGGRGGCNTRLDAYEGKHSWLRESLKEEKK